MSNVIPHHSIRAAARRRGPRPNNMDRTATNADDYDTLARIAVGIFDDMTKAHAPFVDALVAVYLSGLNHGVNAARENIDPDRVLARPKPEPTAPPLRSMHWIKKSEQTP